MDVAEGAAVGDMDVCAGVSVMAGEGAAVGGGGGGGVSTGKAPISPITVAN